jgi:hypothetical protein
LNGFAFTAAQKALVSAGVVASFTTAASNGYFAGGAVKAEYSGGAAQVYVDADKNGSFDPTRDLTIHLNGVAPGTLSLADFRFG